jgi:poly(A) polymerase Pap1
MKNNIDIFFNQMNRRKFNSLVTLNQNQIKNYYMKVNKNLTTSIHIGKDFGRDSKKSNLEVESSNNKIRDRTESGGKTDTKGMTVKVLFEKQINLQSDIPLDTDDLRSVSKDQARDKISDFSSINPLFNY